MHTGSLFRRKEKKSHILIEIYYKLPTNVMMETTHCFCVAKRMLPLEAICTRTHLSFFFFKTKKKKSAPSAHSNLESTLLYKYSRGPPRLPFLTPPIAISESRVDYCNGVCVCVRQGLSPIMLCTCL